MIRMWGDLYVAVMSFLGGIGLRVLAEVVRDHAHRA